MRLRWRDQVNSLKQASGIGEVEVKDSRSRGYPEPLKKYFKPFILY